MDMLQITDLAEKQILLNFDDYQLSHINLVQGDTLSRPFVIQIIGANGEFYRSNPDIQCRLMGVNSNYPDKTYISIGTTFGDAYKVYVTTDMVSRAGTLSLQIGLYDGDRALIQSDVLDVDVNDSLMTGAKIGGDGVLDFMELQAAIVNVEILEENYNKSLDKQKIIYDDIVEKHAHTVELEAELSDVFETEQSRVTAEEQRKSNETQRIADENIRLEQELTRQSEEATRKSAEENRIADEKTRQSEENTRKSQETARQSAEDKRVSAETIRDNNEEKRKSNEIKRENNEVIRIDNENNRIIAEEERKTTFDGWDKTMQGVMPNATDTIAGVVQVEKVEGEETPHKVPTIGRLDNAIAVLKSDVVGKQDKLTAGDNIDIIGDTISAVDTIYNDTQVKADVAKKQDKLTAGDNIDITRDTISATDTITTINGKTGAISKSDITALGLPSQDTVYKKPLSEPISYIQGLQAELDSKVESYGTNPVLNIAVISAGGSTTRIPNNTLILELE